MNSVLDSREDMEVIAMANHAVSSKNSARAGPKLVDPAPVAEYEEIPEEACEIRGEALAVISSACARGSLGLMFLGAIARDLINPWFGLILALACFVWAVCYWKTQRYRRRK